MGQIYIPETDLHTAIPDHLSEVIYHLQRWNCIGISSDHLSAGDAVQQIHARILSILARNSSAY